SRTNPSHRARISTPSTIGATAFAVMVSSPPGILYILRYVTNKIHIVGIHHLHDRDIRRLVRRPSRPDSATAHPGANRPDGGWQPGRLEIRRRWCRRSTIGIRAGLSPVLHAS